MIPRDFSRNGEFMFFGQQGPGCQLHLIFIDQRKEDTEYGGKRRLCSFGTDQDGPITCNGNVERGYCFS
jgi:hypothetical protein